MIGFLKNKELKAFHEILEVAEHPSLLFSNDKEQYNSEARYNLYTIQKLNKLIKKTISQYTNYNRFLALLRLLGHEQS